MNSPKVLIFSILCLVALTLLSIWDFRQSNIATNAVNNASTEYKVLDFLTANITTVKILKDKEAEHIHLQKQKNGHWLLIDKESNTQKKAANNVGVAKFLEIISAYKQQKIINNESKEWGQYGLDKPQRSILLLDDKQNEFSLFLGDQSSSSYGIYLRTNKSATIYLGSAYIMLATNRFAAEFSQTKP